MQFLYISLAIYIVFSVPTIILEIYRLRAPLIFALAAILTLLAWYLYSFDFVFTPLFKSFASGAIVSLVISLFAYFFSADKISVSHVFFAVLTGFLTGFPLCLAALGSAAVLFVIFYLIFSFTRKKTYGDALIIKHRFTVPITPFIMLGTVLIFFFILNP